MPVVISSDSHAPEQVGQDFPEGGGGGARGGLHADGEILRFAGKERLEAMRL